MYMLKNVLELLETTVQRLPDKVAYRDELQDLTFQEAYDSFRAIGTGLAKKGYFKQPVAILMDSRHLPYIQAMVGILYSGCFSAPMDVGVPKDRIDLLLERLEPAAIIYDEKNAELAKTLEDKYDIISFDSLLSSETDDALLDDIRSRTSYYDLLLVMFTSGSTGIPKWVTHSHKDIHLWGTAVIDRFQINEDTVIGNQSPFFYANAIDSIFLPMFLGCSNYVLSASLLSFPKTMVSCMQENRVCDLCMTPSSFSAVADSGALDGEVLPDLQWMVLSGEACNSQAMKVWLASAPNGYVWNHYGSTEALIVAATKLDRKFDEGAVVPSGPLCSEVHMIFVDENDEEVPYGEKGEMLVSSPWMSSGYYKDPERTKEAFVDDPLHKGYHEWFYRTGDLGYINEDNELVVTGRKDNMIKHKGYRMELGEVEYAAKATEGCMDCCCIHKEEGDLLCCFFTGTIEEEELNRVLRSKLPRYAIPDKYIHLDKIPYTATVKADRRALGAML